MGVLGFVGVFVHKHVRATVILTVFAIVLAVFSLILPWYRVTIGWVDDEWTYYSTTEFGIKYFDQDRIGPTTYDPSYSEVGGLMGLTVFIVVIWALLAAAYAGMITPGAEGNPLDRWDGYMTGWALIVTSLMPALVFAALMVRSFNTDGSSSWGSGASIESFFGSDGLGEWGPTSGWYVVVIACALQITAVLARNIPAYLDESGEPEGSAEEDAHGDLPVR